MKSSLMVNNAHMKAELSLLEDTILQMLSASQGNILDDENLINTLAVSKVSLFPWANSWAPRLSLWRPAEQLCFSVSLFALQPMP